HRGSTGAQHKLGTKAAGEKAHDPGPPRRPPGSWVGTHGAELVLPETEVAFLHLGQPHVDRGQLLARFGRGHGPVDGRRVDLALAVVSIPARSSGRGCGLFWGSA